MTPSNPSPDTGAGTPTASPLHPHEPQTPRVMDDEGRCLVCGVEVRLQDIGRIVADLARRSRPATDPAGLDDLIAALDAEMGLPTPEYEGIAKLAIAALRRARLAVADGPGPEERADLPRAADLRGLAPQFRGRADAHGRAALPEHREETGR